jgi:hypothetical protein
MADDYRRRGQFSGVRFGDLGLSQIPRQQKPAPPEVEVAEEPEPVVETIS